MVSKVQTVVFNARCLESDAGLSNCAVVEAPVFRSIPPERLGLTGEYDHSGLAKRVRAALQAVYSSEELAAVIVMQRGGVVILQGQVPSPAHLNKMMETALGIQGATHVETHGVSVISSTP
jgi:hypothetical protein